MISSVLIWIAVIVLFLVGFLGIILPFLPGIPLIFLATLVYGIGTDFREITGNTVLWFLGLTIFALIVDYLSGIIGAKKFGASRMGIIGAFLGMIIGVLSLGLVGLVLGPFLGAVFFEILAGRKEKDAIKIGFGAFVGFLAGTLFKFVLGLIMIGIFFSKIIF
ncbi:MAG: DUF456 domain-containing protein [Patescibacteria group bacterium]